ncbi:MAG TPA: hypothetical protein VGP63_08915 [Planctomycetaceae bacterium]|nr:hypothetical protein [Planctomycetaceae bacterium]
MDRSQLTRFCRTLLAALGGLLVLAAGGCAISMPFAAKEYGAPLSENAGLEEVVHRVNTNIEHLQAWRSSDLRISGKSMPVHLTGHIAVERPRNFRLTASALGMTDEADFGSNSQWFWFWVRRGNPPFVFRAQHDDMARSEALRQAIPFQPDWLIEALGVSPIDPKQVSRIEPGEDHHTVNLVSDLLSPSNQPVKKVVRVDLRHGVVLGQYLYDANNRLIAKADLGKFQVQDGIILPHLISLDWPQADMQINLELGQIEINPSFVATRVFEVPDKGPMYPSKDIGALTRTRQIGQDRERARRTQQSAEEPIADRSASNAGFDAPPTDAAGRASFNSDNGQEWNKPMESSQGSADIRQPQSSPREYAPTISADSTPAPARGLPAKPTPGDPFGNDEAWATSPPNAQPSAAANGAPFETTPH